MNVKFINYAKDYLKYKEEYDKAWEDVNMRGDLILRKDTEEFEQRLAEFVGTKYAVALSSGTDALMLGMKTLREEDILCPSHTFKSTCGAIINSGNFPELYDLGETPRGRVGIVAHIAGELYQPPEVDVLIEDACQALGALKNPTSLFQAWSFYPAKLLGSKGDAGALTTNDEKVYNYVKEARNHFKADNADFGGNHRMDNLQAAILNVKFKYIDEILARRKEIAMMYFNNLHPTILPNRSEERVYQDYIIKTERRDELYDFLKENGVETMRNEYPFSPEYPKTPLAGKYEAETLRIPCNEHLTDEEVSYVIEKIKEFYGSNNSSAI